MILRIIFGTFIGFFCTLFIAQKDPWVKQKVGDSFTRIMADTLDCEVSCTVDFFDIVHPRIFVKDLSLRASDNSWSWSAKTYRSGFSWMDCIKKRCIDMWTHMKDLQAYSKMKDGNPAIAPHIQELIKGPDLPIPLVLSEAKMRQATLMVGDDDIESVYLWHCDAVRDGALFRLHFRFLDGHIDYKKTHYLSDLKGEMHITTQEKNKEIDYALQVDINASAASLGEYPTCFLSGSWHRNRGRFQVQSLDRSLRINPLIIGKKDDDLYVEATASFALDFLYKLFFKTDVSPLSGICAVKFKGSLDEAGSSDGLIVCEDVQHPWLAQPCLFNANFSKRAADWNGMWAIKDGLYHALHGSFDWNAQKEKGEAFAANETTLSFARYCQFVVRPQDAHIQISYDRKIDRLDGTYAMIASHSLTDAKIASKGTCSLDDQQSLTAQGTLGSHYYECGASMDTPYISHVKVWNEKKDEVVDLFYDAHSKKYKSTIDISIVQELCNAFLHSDIHGEGKIRCTASKENNQLYAHLALDEATIRLPQTYNFMSGAAVNIVGDLAKKRLSFNDLHCTLHNGSITSSQATIWFTDEGQLQFVHAPLLIDRCLVTAKQDLFAVISGNLLLSKKEKNPLFVSGNVMLNRAQLKENLFSQQIQKKLFYAAGSMRESKGVPIECDVTVETKEPIKVDTNFLQANAQVGLHVKGSLYDPIVEGSVQVPSGTIGFPYKPLYINKGKITFFKEQPLNPFVELVAKNKIKNHNVTLNVTGSLQDTTVLLESTPPLSEEQVVGLLVAGAHEESLDAVIPALLMQNVTNYLFSSHKSNFFDHYIKPWMNQINVQLKPNFSDESGRGGLRGTLEIVVNERWRAMIEKNFSLTEDTHFELEYILSDDVTFRVIRDERRDVGGEVEMKWKF